MNVPTPQALAAAIGPLLARFLRQNGADPVPAAELALLASRLAEELLAYGLPGPLPPGELGRPGGLAETDGAGIVGRAAGAEIPPLLAEALRQVTKACLHPSFRTCRNSYRETASDGTCRRQQRARVLLRVSGSPCVDCPYWTTLPASEHEGLLRGAWSAGPGAYDPGDEVFLPADFRALRCLLPGAPRPAGGGHVGSA